MQTAGRKIMWWLISIQKYALIVIPALLYYYNSHYKYEREVTSFSKEWESQQYYNWQGDDRQLKAIPPEAVLHCASVDIYMLICSLESFFGLGISEGTSLLCLFTWLRDYLDFGKHLCLCVTVVALSHWHCGKCWESKVHIICLVYVSVLHLGLWVNCDEWLASI